MKKQLVYVPPAEGVKEVFTKEAMAACSTADGDFFAPAKGVGHTAMSKPNSAPGLATKEEMQERIRVLSDEMDANDEENRAMQAEIDVLYAKIDALG